MPDAATPHFGLILPEIGGSDNTWGQKLHDNYNRIDGLFAQPRRNYLLNSAFDVAQRGNSQSHTDGNGPRSIDLWRTLRVGQAYTTTRMAFAAGSAGLPGHPTYFTRVYSGPSTNEGDRVIFYQYVEDVQTLAGESEVTISFYARNVDSTKVAVQVVQNFGSGGSALFAKNCGTVQLTPDWQRHTLTFNVPSIVGKTIGAGSYLSVIFCTSGGSTWWDAQGIGLYTGNVDFANMQMELGPVATPFRRRPITEELLYCWRYYQRIDSNGNYGFFGTGLARSATDARIIVPLFAALRASPSVTIVGSVRIFSGGADPTPNLIASLINGPVLYLNFTTTGLFSGDAAMLSANNDPNAYIALDAEL